MSKIFICYSRRDQEFAKRLQNSLTKYSFDTWIDIQNIPPGKDWADVINTELNNCHLMLVIISPDSMSSIQVSNEWKYFLKRNKPMIPILWKSADIHYQIEPIQFIDFASQDYDFAFNELCDELKKQGIHHVQSQTQITNNACKSGNIFWISHDLMELNRWLLEGISKEWIDVGFRQSLHHAIEIEMGEGIISKIEQLIQVTKHFSEQDWNEANRRQQYAREVTILFNVIAQEIQAGDPNFDSGPG